MDRGMVLFLGCMLTFTSSWLGLVFAPFNMLQNEQPLVDDNTNVAYPRPRQGAELEGRQSYIRNGCIYCHSQQVRPSSFGNNTDIIRGWGTRRSVPRDYIYDKPVMLGTMRTGPDLANVGYRWSADWQHKHLYNPRMMVPGSIMPSFSFLYETRRIVGEPSRERLILSGEWQPEAGYEVVPTSEANSLVRYLKSLDQSTDLPEARENE